MPPAVARALLELYYQPKGESEETLALMRRIDEAVRSKYPFYGARQMVRHLRREGVHMIRAPTGRPAYGRCWVFRRSTGRSGPAIRTPSTVSGPTCSRT